MIAEIIITGDEICSGAVVDGNSSYIAQMLEGEGIQVVRHNSVCDDIDAIVSMLKETASRADITVVTGGLGPTTDDLTAEAAAKAAGVGLVVSDIAQAGIENFFKTIKRSITEIDRKQAMLPEGAECICNPVGTAPGFQLKIGRSHFFFLPGVPFEMRRMFADSVLPRIEMLYGSKREFSFVRNISIFGLAEANINQRLAGLTEKFPEIKLGFQANFSDIYVKLYTRGKDKNICNELLTKASEWVLNKIGDNVFSVDGESMEAVVGGLLRSKKASLAIAESCTGGLLSHWITNVPGSSDYFLFSGVTYSNEAKIKVLGVLPETIERYGAVHEETAKELAEGAMRVSCADYGLATTGIAGPGGGTDEKPVGTVCIGLATPDVVKGYRFNLAFGKRSINKKMFAMKALDLLRMELLSKK
ncbi:MAG: competence/damage-inducible protein A [Deltaproteobacteria bacterium]|nr:competence/damage-inducible protein A [Deltaproteobacteria bacterium]MBW2661299.1 competence/damage-inducible protein A [Deltaproteobacteria bacterium]